MAMTKNEKAYLATLEHQVRLSRALRFTESVKPDLPPPNYMEVMTKGYWFNSHSITLSTQIMALLLKVLSTFIVQDY